jgi:hypothetical protein
MIREAWNVITTVSRGVMMSGLETLIKEYVVLQLRWVDLHWVMCLAGLLQLDQNLESNLERQIGHG